MPAAATAGHPAKWVGLSVLGVVFGDLGRSLLHTLTEIERFRRVAPLHVVQSPYNLFERATEVELLPYCQRNDIVTFGSSALCRGLLSGCMRPATTFMDARPGYQRCALGRPSPRASGGGARFCGLVAQQCGPDADSADHQEGDRGSCRLRVRPASASRRRAAKIALVIEERWRLAHIFT